MAGTTPTSGSPSGAGAARSQPRTADSPGSTPSPAPNVPPSPGTGRRTITQNFEIYGAQSEADLKSLQDLGFTQVIVDLLQLAEPADRLGLGVVLANFWDSSTTPSQVAEVVSLANGLEPLVSINMMDEPILVGLATHAPAVYLRIRDQVRQGGSNAPLSLTEYG